VLRFFSKQTAAYEVFTWLEFRRVLFRSGPGESWLAWIRGASPRAMPAVSTARDWSASNAPRSQNTSTHRAYGSTAVSISWQTSRDRKSVCRESGEGAGGARAVADEGAQG